MKAPKQSLWLNPMLAVVATLLLALLPQLASMPPYMVAATLAPLAWRVTAEVRGWKALNFAWRVLAMLAGLYLLFTYHHSLVGRRAAVGLLSLMLALKLLETFKVRDGRIVASLAIFLCATQFLFAQGLLMLANAVLVSVGALLSLVLLHRREVFGLASGAAPAAGGSLWREAGFVLRMLAIALPVGLALFLFFPRWGNPLWGVPEEVLDAKSGLSDSMTPGSIQSLFMDDSPAFRVVFESPLLAPSQMYWRGPVFWDFDGRTWTGGFFGRSVPAENKPEIRTADWHYTVQMEPTEQHWLFALDYPAVVPRGARLSLDFQLISTRPITELREYEMFSDPDFIDTPRLLTTMRAAALTLPADSNPRTRELVMAWRNNIRDDAEFAQRVLRHFREQGFVYTLNPPLLTLHSVDEFLFDTRAGFCEHYASAFAVMMRMAGVPARIVTGYQGGWYNGFGGYVLVRQSDAHAWAEIWLEGKGWTRIDPTAAVAPERISANALAALDQRRHLLDFAWLRSTRNGFDWLSRTWNDRVIAFNAQRQSGMLSGLGLDDLDGTRLVLLLVGVVALILLAFIPLLLRLRRTPVDPAVKTWRRFLAQLQRAGVSVLPSMGPLDVAQHAASQRTAEAEAIHRVADLYLRMRYARQQPDLDELRRAVRNFRIRN